MNEIIIAIIASGAVFGFFAVHYSVLDNKGRYETDIWQEAR